MLARELLRNSEVRKVLWCWVLQNMPQKAIKPALKGIDNELLVGKLTAFLSQTGLAVPSGPGGGGDTTIVQSGGGSTDPVKAGDCMAAPAAK